MLICGNRFRHIGRYARRREKRNLRPRIRVDNRSRVRCNWGQLRRSLTKSRVSSAFCWLRALTCSKFLINCLIVRKPRRDNKTFSDFREFPVARLQLESRHASSEIPLHLRVVYRFFFRNFNRRLRVPVFVTSQSCSRRKQEATTASTSHS